jgi:hypothetical protein
MVRPGITGWAQINGGNLVTTEEKGALDDWYVRRPSMSAFGGKADAPYAATKKAPADVVVASVLALTGCLRIGDCSVPARTVPLLLKGRGARAIGHTPILADVFGGLEFDCLVAFLGKECLPLWDDLCCEVA